MAIDEDVKRSLDELMLPWPKVTSRRMFGGISYMIDQKVYAMLMEGVVGLKLQGNHRSFALTLAGVSPFRAPSGHTLRSWAQFVILMSEDTPSLAPWLDAAYKYVVSLHASRK